MTGSVGCTVASGAGQGKSIFQISIAEILGS
jgi:hypothetical protein